METSPSVQTSMEPSEEPTMSFGARLGNIVFEPWKTYADIDRKPTWLGTIILMSILGIAASYVVMNKMDYASLFRQNPMSQNMTDEQIQQALNSPFIKYQRYATVVATPVVLILMNLAIAGVYVLVFVLMGTSLQFRKAFSVTCWAMLPRTLITDLLISILASVKDTIADPNNLIASNLGAVGLLDQKAHPALQSILGSIDAFSIWTIALLSIGFAKISNRELSTSKSAWAVLTVWFVYILGKAGFAFLFSLIGR